MQIFSKKEIDELLTDSQIGLWKVEFSDEMPPFFYADDVMDQLLGVSDSLTPQERFAFHHKCIHPDDLRMFEEYSDKLLHEKAEVVYRYIHPQRGEMFVRCSGYRDCTVTDRVCIKGTHQNISDTMRLEKDKIAEVRLAEKNKDLEQQLNIIQTFGKAFNSSYYINMTDGTFIELSVNRDGVQDIISKEGIAQEQFEVMLKQLVKPEHVESMRKFTVLSTLNDRLRNKNWISNQFEGPWGWAEGMFIAANRDENGDCLHVIWATRSIEEYKRKEIEARDAIIEAKEKATEANEAKTRFLFNMSHDIRTPMNAIMGFATLLENNLDDKELCREYLGKMKSSSEFLLSLINNVLEMARIESGKGGLEESAWSVEQFNDSLFNIFEQPMKEKGIHFEREISVEHHYVFCDPVKLREIYLNLLSNACKYTPTGGTVKMSLIEIPSDKVGYARYKTTISDSGIGMAKEYLPKMFEEFTREYSTTESKIEGTGLGLSIVKKLVDLMGGDIQVESELGKGSTFVVTVYHRIAEESDVKSQNVKLNNEDIFKGKHILLAEDNDLNAEIAMSIISETGASIDRAEDGVVCVNMLSEAATGYYDLILMDIQMPNLDGYGATKQIRAMKDKDKADIPIVAITANAFDEDKKQSIEAGMNGHLAKPIKVDELIAKLVNIWNLD